MLAKLKMELETILGMAAIYGAITGASIYALTPSPNRIEKSAEKVRESATKAIDSVIAYYSGPLSQPQYANQLKELAGTRARTGI